MYVNLNLRFRLGEEDGIVGLLVLIDRITGSDEATFLLQSHNCKILLSYKCKTHTMGFGNKRQKKSQEPPRISDAEWAVMKTVWSLRTATAREVVEALAGEASWRPKTIHTLLARLVQKGALAKEKPGREYIFRPLFTEQECRLAASKSFLARVFDGEIAPFLACFLDQEKLSRKEIEELKNIINGKAS